MTRDKILDAARDILARDGLQGLSIRKIAAKVGLSAMAIYRHFADKEALVTALMLDGFVAWESKVRAIRTRDPVRYLIRVADAYLDFALTDPHRFDAAFLLSADEARRYPGDFARGQSPVIAMAMARIEEAQREGRLRPVPPLDIALTISALAQGLISMQRAGRFESEAQFRRLYRRSIAQALEGYSTGRKEARKT